MKNHNATEPDRITNELKTPYQFCSICGHDHSNSIYSLELLLPLTTEYCFIPERGTIQAMDLLLLFIK